jgi:hypothetical protein
MKNIFVNNLYNNINNKFHHFQIQNKYISRLTFIHLIQSAIDKHGNLAIGKLGRSQQCWMYYQIALDENKVTKEFEKQLMFHCAEQEGVFPVEFKFIQKFNQFYVPHVKNLDVVGTCNGQYESRIVQFYKLHRTSKLIDYKDQEPDRSTPSNDMNCYLRFFRNKTVLIICPFAELLRERSGKTIFEGVWAKTGKKWFYPADVKALTTPYCFSSEAQNNYRDVIQLFDNIKEQVSKINFDVALIASGPLAIPLASHIKTMGKIGIDLGGHLQVLFGVIGARWRDRKDWQEMYFNDFWIDMPKKYIPAESLNVCDKGAYW